MQGVLIGAFLPLPRARYNPDELAVLAPGLGGFVITA